MKPYILSIILFAAAAQPMLASPPSAADLDNLLQSGDVNGDGVVSREEFLTLRAAMFPQLDTDASGGVSPSELKTVLNDRVSRFASKAFKKIDANGNGAISEDEWASSPARGFDLADKNKDGVLSAEERARKP